METAIYQGSPATFSLVKKQIINRWGEEEGKKYNPLGNCFTFNTWKAKGFKVKKGEKALRSFSIKTNVDKKTGEKKAYPVTVCLFYQNQVEKI